MGHWGFEPMSMSRYLAFKMHSVASCLPIGLFCSSFIAQYACDFLLPYVQI